MDEFIRCADRNVLFKDNKRRMKKVNNINSFQKGCKNGFNVRMICIVVTRRKRNDNHKKFLRLKRIIEYHKKK